MSGRRREAPAGDAPVRTRSISSCSTTGSAAPPWSGLKGGDPFVFGRGGEEAEVLTRAGVPWEVVPGVSSAFAVPAVAGIPVTHRGLSSSVTVVTGRVDDPIDGVQWEALAKIDGTLVILMGMMDRAEIADALQRGGKAGATPTAVIERGTTADQVVVRTTLDQLADGASRITCGDRGRTGGRSRGARAGRDGADRTVPLAGRTVVVARSGPRAQGLLDALRHAGAEPLSVALTEQTEAADGGAALRAAVNELAEFHLGRLHLGQRRDAVHGRGARRPGLRLDAGGGGRSGHGGGAAASGHRARSGARRARGARSWWPDSPTTPRVRRATRCCFPVRTSPRRPSLTAFVTKGWQVHRVAAYRTVALPPPEPAVLRAHGPGRRGHLHGCIFGPGVCRARDVRRVSLARPAGGHLHRPDHGRGGEGSGHDGSGRGPEHGNRRHRRSPRAGSQRSRRCRSPGSAGS